MVNTLSSNLQAVQLTSPAPGEKDYNPVIVGGHVYFLSSRSGSPQIWQLADFAGGSGTPTQLTNYPITSLANLKMAGNTLAFSAQVYVDCPAGAAFECTADRLATQAAMGPNTGYIYDELFVRHWDTWITPKLVSHIFVAPIQHGVPSVIGPVSDAMQGLSANSPVPYSGGPEQFDLLVAQGDVVQVAYTAAIVDAQSAWNTSWRVYTSKVSGGVASARQWTSSGYAGRCQNPAYNSLSGYLSFLFMERPGSEADRLQVALLDLNTGVFRNLTSNFTYSINNQKWVNATVLMLEVMVTYPSLSYLDLTWPDLTPNYFQSSFAGSQVQTDAAQRVYFLGQSWVQPTELFVSNWIHGQGGSRRQVTQVNPSLTGSVIDPDNFSFEADDGTTVYGYLFDPRPLSNASWPAKIPTVLLIHGGPESAWSSSWSYRWNPQIWLNRGYAVVMINPRGSTGYGQNFTDQVIGDWGGYPFTDLMTGLELVLEDSPWMDATRLGACGASYGGYMINWIQSQADHPFKSLVCHDGKFDLKSGYYSTEELWFPENEFGGVPWTHGPAYDRHSPSEFVGNWSTPTLVIHGGKDYRVDLSQGLATFTTLQRKGIPSKFLYFPEENHWVTSPRNSLLWYSTILDWLDSTV